MSITTLKRKTDGRYHVRGGEHGIGFRNVISSGIFSLNDPRRVEAHTGEPSLQTRMRGTGYRGHGTKNIQFLGTPVRSSYQNTYDPYHLARVSRPKPVPACPVVQAAPVTFSEKIKDLEYEEIRKELCSPTVPEACPKTCSNTHSRLSKQSNSNVVKKMTHSYQDVLIRRKKPLPPGKEHYPPQVSRNSTFTSVPGFSYADFVARLTCPSPAPTLTITNSGTGAYLIAGASNAIIHLVRNQTYHFEINASGHPFWIQTSSGSFNISNRYDSGVTNNGIDLGTITFVVPANAPSTLYYVCQFHSSMNGIIQIV